MRRLRAAILLASMAAPSLAPALAAATGAKAVPVNPAQDIGFDQKLGDKVPLDLEFRDETGKSVRLGDYVRDRPVILSLAYYGCPMLCGLALQGLASSLKPLGYDAGKEFRVVTVSFDPRETPEMASKAKPGYLALYGRPGAEDGWHFLTGPQDSIDRLTKAVGFRYAWDEEQQQFAHATGIVLLTPEGRVARYFFGVDYEAKDLRLGLIESAGGRIGSLADRLLLLCYQYDPHTGRYSAAAMGLVRVAAALGVAGLATFVVVLARRDRRRRDAGEGGTAS
jgi:protein SCO1/2